MVFRVLRNVSLVCFCCFLPADIEVVVAFRVRLLREEEAAQKQRQAGWTVSEAHGMPHPFRVFKVRPASGFLRGYFHYCLVYEGYMTCHGNGRKAAFLLFSWLDIS